MHITFADLKKANKGVIDPIKKKFGAVWEGMQATPDFIFKKKCLFYNYFKHQIKCIF